MSSRDFSRAREAIVAAANLGNSGISYACSIGMGVAFPDVLGGLLAAPMGQAAGHIYLPLLPMTQFLCQHGVRLIHIVDTIS